MNQRRGRPQEVSRHLKGAHRNLSTFLEEASSTVDWFEIVFDRYDYYSTNHDLVDVLKNQWDSLEKRMKNLKREMESATTDEDIEEMVDDTIKWYEDVCTARLEEFPEKEAIKAVRGSFRHARYCLEKVKAALSYPAKEPKKRASDGAVEGNWMAKRSNTSQATVHLPDFITIKTEE